MREERRRKMAAVVFVGALHEAPASQMMISAEAG